MRRRWAALVALVALTALTVTWRLLPVAPPPLYDGVCLADPYRTLGHSPAPLAASQSFPAEASGKFPTFEVTTDGVASNASGGENPPQGQLLLEDGTFVSTAPFSLSIKPVSPPAPPPAGEAIDGNVYEMVAVTSGGTQLQPQPGIPATIILRATSANPPKTMYRYSGGTWTALKTFSAGCGDAFEAVSPQMGYFALMVAHASSSSPSSPGGAPIVPIVIALALVLAGTAAGLYYLNRGHAR